MESMFIWIVLFSGAAVLLLGVFLVASEKELKKKRNEINDLMGRLEGASTASASAPSAAAAANGAEVTGLRAKNQELQKDIAALQDDLDAAQRAIDELRATQPAADNGATFAEIQQLRNANTQLDAQVDDLRRQLQASQATPNSASTSDSGASERQTQLENSLLDLKQQLEKSQARNRELERSATPMVDVSAIEANHREESQKLQARVAELENSLGASAESARRIDSLEQRIRESEKLEQELRAALRQREEELPQWQERLAASDEIKNRLLALQPVYDQLVAKQNSLIEHQREYHGELKSFAQFLSASHDGTIAQPIYTYFDPQANQEETMPAQSQISPMTASNASDLTRAPESASAGQVNGDVETAPKTKRGFGVFHAVIAVVVGGALAVLFWSQSGDQPVTHAAKPSPVAAPAQKPSPAYIPQQAAATAETVASAAQVNNNNADAPVGQIEPAIKAKAQPATRAVAGTYEVTRGTRVFAAPTEFSQQVGEIEPGLKVNVVNARDGWLEIHSKHGRPPGFIRSDAAARVGG
jgi:hypothetical protein